MINVHSSEEKSKMLAQSVVGIMTNHNIEGTKIIIIIKIIVITLQDHSKTITILQDTLKDLLFHSKIFSQETLTTHSTKQAVAGQI